MPIAIVTFCVGADYKRAMEPGLESKRQYAKRHGYDIHIGGEDVWDRTRPIPWSKLRFIQKYLDSYDYLFVSDADVVILDQTKRLEVLIHALLPKNKDILWTLDACNNYNNGNMFIRGKNTWVRDFFPRVYEQTDVIHHIWWDNAGMIRLFETNSDDASHIETTKSHWLINAYLFGPDNLANTTKSVRLYQQGDFLIHFAGVYDIWNIYRMMKYVLLQTSENKPIHVDILDKWRKSPPCDKQDANKSLEIHIVNKSYS